MQLKHRKLTEKEEEQTIIKILDTLLDDSIPYSGKHRKEQWEKGWGENLKTGDVIPRYFNKYPIFRYKGKFVKACSDDYERQMLYTIVDRLAKEYLSEQDCVVEFGCGTGHNLLRVQKFNKNADFWGGDWVSSSQKIVNKLGGNFSGFKFDFFNPSFCFPKGTGVYTVAALEQTGTNYKKFVSYLLKNKPSVVVHIEPIPELLDETKLIDYLSIKYMQKRKYLSGYLTYLEELEKKGKILILRAKRSGIGSMMIDGYSEIVWKPI